MGKWKYINGLVVIVVLGHMYAHFYQRYEAPFHLYVSATIGVLIFALLGGYIFVYRLNKTQRNPSGSEENKIVVKEISERPKVMLKKKNGDQ